MSKNTLYIVGAIILIIIVLAIVFFFAQKKTSQPQPLPTTVTQTIGDHNQTAESNQDGFKQEEFQNIKTPHFVSSTPANNEVLKNFPTEVTINFNFDLVEGSKIGVSFNGSSIVDQQTKISADKLSMTLPIYPATFGNYKVDYTACWPDGSCHNGSFGFSVSP